MSAIPSPAAGITAPPEQAPQDNTGKNRICAFKWAASLLLPLVVFLLPESTNLTLPMKTFLYITLWAVISWAVKTMDDVVTAMALPVLYVLAGLLPYKLAMSSWTAPLTILAIGGLILGKIVMDTGLAKRVALWCVHAMGGSFSGALIGLTLAAAIVAPFVPSITGKVILFGVIAIGLCDALGYKPMSREATAICLATYMAVTATKLCYLTGGGDVVLPITIMDEVTGVTTTWLTYAMYNFIPGMLYAALSLGLVLVLLRPTNPASVKEISMAQYKSLGPMSNNERKAGYMMLITLALLLTEPFHKIPTAITMFLMGLAAFLPGINFMTGKSFGSMNLNIVFFINGCMAIGICANAVGMNGWMSEHLLVMLENSSPVIGTLTCYVIGLLINFLLTPIAAFVSLTGPLVSMAQGMNIDPRIFVHAFQYGLDQYVLPYEYAPLLLAFGMGYIGFGDMVKVLAVRMVVTGVFIVVIAYPFWSFVSSL